jgi:hypothetical protein
VIATKEGRMQPRALLDGLAIPESPRWHEGRLWFSNWGTRQIVAVDLDGNSEVVGEGPDGLGWATNWLPDGRLLITGQERWGLISGPFARLGPPTPRAWAGPRQCRATGRELRASWFQMYL